MWREEWEKQIPTLEMVWSFGSRRIRKRRAFWWSVACYPSIWWCIRTIRLTPGQQENVPTAGLSSVPTFWRQPQLPCSLCHSSSMSRSGCLSDRCTFLCPCDCKDRVLITLCRQQVHMQYNACSKMYTSVGLECSQLGRYHRSLTLELCHSPPMISNTMIYSSATPTCYSSTSCLCICLFRTFHVNGVMQCVTVGNWLLPLSIVFSRFIRSVTSTLHSCSCVSHIPLYGHTK